VQTFRVLRSAEKALLSIPRGSLAVEVRRIISREARLAWKARMEAAEPALLVESAEIESRISTLGAEDTRMRDLNQAALNENPAAGEVGSAGDWAEITTLRGPRGRRLRGVVER